MNCKFRNYLLPGSWSSIGASQVDLAVQYLENKVTVTANTLHRKLKTTIPRNETARPRSQFLHLCICKRYTIFSRSIYLFCCSNKGGPIESWEYITRSHTDTMKLGTRPRVSFLGVHIYDPVWSGPLTRQRNF
jgi:hypothetical protein